MQKLQVRWKVNSSFQVIIILLVFACTGYTVVFMSKPILNYLYNGQTVPLLAKIVYYILILPFYNIFLLGYGFVFGQFHFFWNFEKRFFNRIISIFKKQ
ncbi:MAG: DUF6787 family protein [Bacteroidota bacterium]